MNNVKRTSTGSEERARAIRQYRYLLKLHKIACRKNLYSIASEYRMEINNLREKYNL